jgi:hypothetical protein
MEKVICIEKCVQYSGDKPYWYSPEVGAVLEVVKAKTVYGRVFYDLDGYSEFLYDARFFATLPDESADEMAEEEQFIYDQFSC